MSSDDDDDENGSADEENIYENFVKTTTNPNNDREQLEKTDPNPSNYFTEDEIEYITTSRYFDINVSINCNDELLEYDLKITAN